MDKVSKDVFNSIEFQSKSWYQGCSEEIVIPSDASGNYDFSRINEIENSGKYYAESKLDGNWNVTFRGDEVRSFSRSCKRKDLVTDEFAKYLPEGTALVGEALRGTQFAVAMQKKYGYEFNVIWDILFHNYIPVKDLPAVQRKVILKTLLRSLPQDVQNRFRLIPTFGEKFSDEYVGQQEGLVFKPMDEGPYIGEGKKVKYWIKCKKWYESDAIILGYEKSTAETKVGKDLPATIVVGLYVKYDIKGFENAWNSIEKLPLYTGVNRSNCKLGCIYRDGDMYTVIPVARPTCGDQTLGRELVDNFDKHLYQVMKVKHFEQFESGSFRHPSPNGGIYSLRDDKEPKDCVFTGVTYKVF